jgi:hypothetical protein
MYITRDIYEYVCTHKCMLKEILPILQFLNMMAWNNPFPIPRKFYPFGDKIFIRIKITHKRILGIYFYMFWEWYSSLVSSFKIVTQHKLQGGTKEGGKNPQKCQK